MINLDIPTIRNQIINKGYYVINNLFSINEIETFRENISHEIKQSSKFNYRINSHNIEDYSHMRSHDSIERTIRYYMFFHNSKKWNANVKNIINTSIDLRNQIEFEWNSDFEYSKIKKNLQDYIIVTQYFSDTGMLKYHRDFPKKTKYPLLQFNILLSEFNKDYKGGDFVLKDNNNKDVFLHKDLKANIGDALIFNKYLLHKVENTYSGITDIGRWSILIGARAEYTKSYKLYLHKLKLIELTNKIKKFIIK
tara:strand:- start:530 stop:1285 length:756 start_codon:yes stop_codon:yes gene_type:complete